MATITVLPSYIDPTLPYASGGGSFDVDDTATILAHVPEGYRFLRWTDSSGKEYLELQLSFKVKGDETYTAHFKRDFEPVPEDEGEDQPGERRQFTITVSTYPVAPGFFTVVDGDGTYYEGDVCTLSLLGGSEALSSLVGWSNEDWGARKVFCCGPNISFRVFKDAHYVVNFKEPWGMEEWSDSEEHAYREQELSDARTIRVTIDTVDYGNGISGTVSVNGGMQTEGCSWLFYPGEQCTMTATPYTSSICNNKFLFWKRTGDALYTSESLEIRKQSPYSFRVYAPDQYWHAFFGPGLVYVEVDTNMPTQLLANETGGNVRFDVDLGSLGYYSDVKRIDEKIVGITVLRTEFGLISPKLEWKFARPNNEDEYGLYYLNLIRDFYSGKYELRSVSEFEDEYVLDYHEGRFYFAYGGFGIEWVTENILNLSNVWFWLSFKKAGYILRGASGNVLRNDTDIWRAHNQ